MDPRTFYEPVEPSAWKPPEGDSCLELHRRAYCSHGDAILPPLYFTVFTCICYLQILPVWAILLLLIPAFGVGMHCLVFRGKAINSLPFCPNGPPPVSSWQQKHRRR